MARRVALAALVVAGVIIATFVIARVVPGDPAATWAGPHASAAQVAAARRFLGLDRPALVQLLAYFGGILTGNWGLSIHTHQPVLSDIGTAAPASLELVTVALIIALAVAVPLGLISARWPGGLADQAIRAGSILGVSMPIFWMALILQLVFSQRLHVLPAAGEYSPGLLFSHPLAQRTGFSLIDATISGNWPMLGSILAHLVLPALVVAAYPAGLIARMVRAQVLDTVAETHVQMVRALGFSERAVYSRFAMKLAWNPVAAAVALVFGYSLVNTFLVEAIFDWPGLGSYTAASVATLDTPAILGRDPVRRAGLRGRQPGRGHHPGRPGPEDQAAMIEAPTPGTGPAPVLPRGRALRQGLRANPLLLAGGLTVVLIVVVAALAPLLAPFPGDAATATHPFLVLRPPSARHWFGTDQVGRDVFSRVLYGARISPLVAVIVLLIACAIGIPLGIVAGYFGGWVDEVIMRVTDIFLAFPSLLLALALATVLPTSLTSLTIAIAVTWWPWYTRLIRGQAASVAGRPYIDSCRVLGIARWRIILRHVLPNSVTPLIVQVSLDVGGVILTASALSFLGLGAQDPTPDWGLMVSEGQTYFTTDWWVVTFPGIAILVTAFAFNLLGDGLRDLLDPRRSLLP